MRFKLVVIPVLAILLLFALMGGGPSLAQKTTDLRGQVVNGTGGASLPANLSVLMLITASDGRLSGTGQATPDDEGRFVFEDVQVLEGNSYAVSVDHLGIFYGKSLDATELDDGLTLTIFETTGDASIIEVKRQVMVIAAVDEGTQTLSAIEFVQIDNPSDRTLAPDLTNVEQISFLRFSLPPDPSDLTVNSDLPAGDIVSIGTGFALASPIVPGPHSIDFSYTFPFNDETLAFRQSLVQGTEVFQVWVPEVISGVGVNGLTNIDPVNVQGTSYRAYGQTEVPRGQGVDLEFTGLPLAGVWARFSDSITEGKFWQVAIPSALGAALAAMLLYGLIWGYRPAAVVDGPDASPAPLSSTERAGVVRAVADLDQRYQQGDVPDTDYQAQRTELISQVLGCGDDGQPAGDDQ